MEKRNNCFDILRVAAMILIILYHYTTRYIELVEPVDLIVRVPSYIATFGVSIFLCLTGYFSYHSLVDNRSDSLSFLKKRVIRLCPAFWICLVIASVVLTISGRAEITPKQFLLNAFLINRIFGVPSVDGAYWYMMILMIFTVNLGVLIPFSNKVKNVYFIVYGCLMFIGGITNLAFKFVPELVVWALFKYINKCYFGLILAYVFDKDRGKTVKQKILCLFYGAVIILSEGLWVEVERFIPDVCSVVVVTGVLLLSLRLPIEDRYMKPIYLLSGCSYFLYLIHEEVGFVLIQSITRYGVDPHVSVLLAICIMIAISIGYYILEKKIASSFKSLKKVSANEI